MSSTGQPTEFLELRFASIAPEIDELHRNLLRSAGNLDAVSQALRARGIECRVNASGDTVTAEISGYAAKPRALILPCSLCNGRPGLAYPATVFFGLLKLLDEISDSRRPVQLILSAMPSSAPPVMELAADEITVTDFDQALRPGQVGFLTGTIIPSQQRFELTVLKKDSEFDGTNVYNLVPLAAHIVATISQIPTRKTDPLKMARVGFTSISSSAAIAGGPATAVALRGVIHAPEASVAKLIPQLIEQESLAVAGALDLSVKFETGHWVPPITSDPQLQAALRDCCVTCCGKANIVNMEFLTRDYCGLISHSEQQGVASLHVGIADPTGSQAIPAESHETNLRAIQNAIRMLALFYSR